MTQNPLALAAPAVFNLRDLGGNRTTDGGVVRYGRLYRSDSLHRLTDAQCAQLLVAGVRTIVDLRRPQEIERDGRMPRIPGLGYLNIDRVHRDWGTAELLPEIGPARYLADRYLDMALTCTAGLGEVLRLIAEPEDGAMIVHCVAGKDRTGLVAALTLGLLGVSDDDIAADYAASEQAQATITEQIRADLPGSPRDDPPAHLMVCPPAAMLLFLAGLRARFGSMTEFAAHAGVTARQIASLRAHLLD
jgi:protein tyrosine/serine phosphatase